MTELFRSGCFFAIMGALQAFFFGAFAVVAAEQVGTRFKPTAQADFVPNGARFELLWDEGDFTEGPAPDADGTILFSDIGNRIMRYDPDTGETTVYRADSGKANGLMFDAEGRLVACEGAAGGNRRISITERDGSIRTLADRYQGRRFNSPNDLAIDAAGRVYFTDPRYVGDEPRELDFEGVFVIQPGGEVLLATRDIEKPNGILVAPDGGTVYVADNNNAEGGNRHLLAFSVADDGTLVEKSLLHDFGPTMRGIDGMTLDREGNLYATAGSGADGGIYVFSPQGEHLAFIATPGTPTNCVFGLGDAANVLYVTAAVPATEDQAAGRWGLYRITLQKPGYHVFAPKGT